MKAAIQLLVGGRPGKRIDLRDGQRAEFGRTEWADFCIPDDPAMAEVHFAVECRFNACLLLPLVADRDTLLNGEKTGEATLHTGDRITAGRTIFVVAIEGEAAPVAVAVAAAAGAADPAKPAATDFVAVCKFLDLPDALPVAQADLGQSRDAFLSALAGAGKYPSAARLYAHWLPKRAAVWWGCLCVREACGEPLAGEQEGAWQSAKKWVETSAEPERRAAEAAYQRAAYAGPGGMLAAAAFGAGDSIAPPNSPTAVPPDPRLTGHAVKTALVFASVHGDSRRAGERWKWFLTLAQDVIAGKIKLPGAG
jgi:hypothetical protein